MTTDHQAVIDGYRRLAAAVLLRAHKDAQSGSNERTERELCVLGTLAQDARAFLQSPGCAALAEALDIDPAGLAVAGMDKHKSNGGNDDDS